jgi:hypothetical protein
MGGREALGVEGRKAEANDKMGEGKGLKEGLRHGCIRGDPTDVAIDVLKGL